MIDRQRRGSSSWYHKSPRTTIVIVEKKWDKNVESISKIMESARYPIKVTLVNLYRGELRITCNHTAKVTWIIIIHCSKANKNYLHNRGKNNRGGDCLWTEIIRTLM